MLRDLQIPPLCQNGAVECALGQVARGPGAAGAGRTRPRLELDQEQWHSTEYRASPTLRQGLLSAPVLLLLRLRKVRRKRNQIRTRHTSSTHSAPSPALRRRASAVRTPW